MTMTKQVRTCRACGKTAAITEFRIRGTQGHYRRLSTCKNCRNRKWRERWPSVRGRSIQRIRDGVAKDQAAKRAIILVAKSKPCADCGIQYEPHVMDFDHVRGKKAFGLHRGHTKGRTAIATEIAKCDVVCANCHRERTYRRLRS